MERRNVVADKPSVRVPYIGYSEMDELNRLTAYNRRRVERSKKCGCFHCGSTFKGSEVAEWLHEEDGEDSALCPYCGVDSVIYGTKKYQLSTAMLSSLYMKWFADEYKKRKETATEIPKFKGHDDYLRKGIPFLLRETDELEILGEIDLFPVGDLDDECCDESEEDGLFIGEDDMGVVVSVRASADKQGCLAPEFFDEVGRRLPYEPWSGTQEKLVLDLVEKHGDALRGIIKESGILGKMRLFAREA